MFALSNGERRKMPGAGSGAVPRPFPGRSRLCLKVVQPGTGKFRCAFGRTPESGVEGQLHECAAVRFVLSSRFPRDFSVFKGTRSFRVYSSALNPHLNLKSGLLCITGKKLCWIDNEGHFLRSN